MKKMILIPLMVQIVVLEVEEDGTVHPFQAVDHVLRGDNAPVIFTQNGLRGTPEAPEIGECPREDEGQEEKYRAIPE